MEVLRVLSIFIIIVTIYVRNAESGIPANTTNTTTNNATDATNNNATDATTNNATDATSTNATDNTGNPQAEALTDTNVEVTNTSVKVVPRMKVKTRRIKTKRRLRKKRPVKKTVKKNEIEKASSEIIIPSDSLPKVETVKVKKTIIIQPNVEPVATVVKATATVVKAAAAKKAAKKKPVMDFSQDSFFDLFEETTPTPVDPNAPPPGFSVKKTKSQKVMPNVDSTNSKAYDGSPCNATFKNHSTDKTKYMMKYADDRWATLDCPPNLASGLVWRQDLCSCGEELVAIDPNDTCASIGFGAHPTSRHKYLRIDQGSNAEMDCSATLVWSQEKCLCIYDSTVEDRPIENHVTFVCKTILKMEFEGNLTNIAEGYLIKPVNLRRRGKLPRIRYRKIPGSTEKAAMIVSQPLEFLAFSGNDFQKQVTYALSFKLSPRHMTRENYMVLLTDECLGNLGGQNKARKPGIKLAFQPSTQTFNLQFRTIDTDVNDLIKGAKPDMYGWYKVVVYFEDNTLSMEVNGQKVFTQANVMGKIPQNKCPLFIAGRGRGFDRSQDFYGYMDNVHLVKDCKFHEANIKFL